MKCARTKAEVKAQMKRYGIAKILKADAERLGLGPIRKPRG